MVQGRAAHWVCSKYRWRPNCTGLTEMINHLSWPNLELCRKVARLTLLYKMSNKLFMMSTRSFLVRAPRDLRSVPPHAFMPLSRIPTCLYQTNSFFPKTVADWNELPYQIFSFITSGIQSLSDEASTLVMLDMYLTHYSFLSAHVFSLYSQANTLCTSFLNTLPWRWALYPFLSLRLYCPPYIFLSAHIHLIAPYSAHSSHHPTSSLVNKLTFCHTYLNLNPEPLPVSEDDDDNGQNGDSTVKPCGWLIIIWLQIGRKQYGLQMKKKLCICKPKKVSGALPVMQVDPNSIAVNWL